jgi:hypothetical protein
MTDITLPAAWDTTAKAATAFQKLDDMPAAANVANAVHKSNRTKGKYQLCPFGNSITASLSNFALEFARASKGAIEFKKNAGIGGNNSNQMVARLTDIDGTLVTIMEATNDYSAGVSLAQHAANINTSIDYVDEIESLPVVMMAPPHNTRLRSEYVYEANLYDYCSARNKGVPCLGIWGELTDPLNGSWITAKAASGLNPNSAFMLDDNSDGLPNNWATNANRTAAALNTNLYGIGNQWETSWVAASGQLFANSSRWDVEAGKTYRCEIDCGMTLNSGAIDFDLYMQFDVTVNAVDRVYFVDGATASLPRKKYVIEFEVPIGVSSLRFVASANTGTFTADLVLAQANIVEADDIKAGIWLPSASGDGTHPLAVAEQIAGAKAANDFLLSRFHTPYPVINDYVVPNVILSSNACFLTDTDTNGVPDSWAAGTYQSSKLLKTGLGIGNTWRTKWVNNQIYINSTQWNVTAGDRYLCVLNLDIDIEYGHPNIRAYMKYDVSIGGVDSVFMIYDAPINVVNRTITTEFIVPDGVSKLQFVLSASSGTYSVQVDIAQAQVFNLTHYDLVEGK